MAPREKARPTAADVARLSGVSRTTVSYVLNDNPRQSIPDATRARVRDAAAALGYAPSAVAASLRRGHSHTVVLVTDSSQYGYTSTDFLEYIGERVTASGYGVVHHLFSGADALVDLVAQIVPYGVLSLTTIGLDTAGRLRDLGVRHVYLTENAERPGEAAPWELLIGAQQYGFARDIDPRPLVFVIPPPSDRRAAVALQRWQGFAAEASDRAEAAPRLLRLTGDATTDAASVAAVVDGDGAIACAFDDIAAAMVLTAARTVGIPVPRRLAVLGGEEMPFAAFLDPPLSSVRHDAAASGTTLIETFLQTLTLQHPAVHRLSAPLRSAGSLIERGTTLPREGAAASPGSP